MKSTIKELQKHIYGMAVSKGWWEKERTPLEIHALIHSEISEATEEARKDKPPLYFQDLEALEEGRDNTADMGFYEKYIKGKDKTIAEWKPEGEAIELVDAVIRIMDYFGHKNWDFNELLKIKLAYNATRPYRHGNKKY